MDDNKKRIERAILKHHERAARRDGNSARKNNKPEQSVVKEVLKWAKSRGLDLHVVESKAVYSASAGRYLHSQTSESLPDLLGNYQGLSVWIECKAKGRVSTLKEHQRAFLARKATQNCFACVTDSVKRLENYFDTFLTLLPEDRPTYLLSHLKPKKPHSDESDLF